MRTRALSRAATHPSPDAPKASRTSAIGYSAPASGLDFLDRTSSSAEPILEREAIATGARSNSVPATEHSPVRQEHPAPQPVPPPGQACLQRAIGLEFEVKDWHVRHIGDKSKLTKGTETIVKQDGVDLTADDDGERSDIEWVTGPLESRDEVLYVIDQARDLGLAMSKQRDEATIPASSFDDFGKTHPDAELDPGDRMNATMQATVGVPLERMAALYQALKEAEGPTSAKATALLDRAGRAGLVDVKGVNRTVSEPPIPLDAMSEALKGFLLLVIDYLRTGFSGDPGGEKRQHEQFPKGNLNLLVKTSFRKMFDLIPEKDALLAGKAEQVMMSDKWIHWIVEAAIPGATSDNVGEKKQRRVLDYEYGISNVTEGEDEKPYFVDVSREAWLRRMPTEDLLRHDNKDVGVTFPDGSDPAPLSEKLEGFAALGTKTDKDVTQIAKGITSTLYSKLDASPAPSDPMDKGKGKMEESLSPKKDDVTSEKVHGAPGSGEAPVMELRHLSSSGGDPTTWPANALSAWDIYAKAIGDKVYRAGNHRELDFYVEGYSERRPPELDPNLRAVETGSVGASGPSSGHQASHGTSSTKPGFLKGLWNALSKK